jgi:hypothetical protein
MTGYVYAMRSEDIVKIGWSRDPEKRLSKVNSDTPTTVQLVGYVAATIAQEAELHRLFAPWRMSNEWYRLVGPVAAFVTLLPPRPKAGGRQLKDVSARSALSAWRLKSGLTLEQAGELLGITKSHMCGIESGARKIGPIKAAEVSFITGVPASELRPDVFRAAA